MPQLEFSLKPHLCILSEKEEACYDELQVSWRAPEEMSLCLYRGELDKPLKCWYQARHGQHKFVLSATQNVVFHLRQAADDNTLVSEAFEVIHDRQQYRRQRRNPWSFF